MTCLTVNAWGDVFRAHENDPGEAGEMATVLGRICSIVGDPCYTPVRMIELIEKMFDRMALRALEAADGEPGRPGP